MKYMRFRLFRCFSLIVRYAILVRTPSTRYVISLPEILSACSPCHCNTFSIYTHLQHLYRLDCDLDRGDPRPVVVVAWSSCNSILDFEHGYPESRESVRFHALKMVQSKPQTEQAQPSSPPHSSIKNPHSQSSPPPTQKSYQLSHDSYPAPDPASQAQHHKCTKHHSPSQGFASKNCLLAPTFAAVGKFRFWKDLKNLALLKVMIERGVGRRIARSVFR